MPRESSWSRILFLHCPETWLNKGQSVINSLPQDYMTPNKVFVTTGLFYPKRCVLFCFILFFNSYLPYPVNTDCTLTSCRFMAQYSGIGRGLGLNDAEAVTGHSIRRMLRWTFLWAGPREGRSSPANTAWAQDMKNGDQKVCYVRSRLQGANGTVQERQGCDLWGSRLWV